MTTKADALSPAETAYTLGWRDRMDGKPFLPPAGPPQARLGYTNGYWDCDARLRKLAERGERA